jgi:antagonist of KipI
MSVRVLAPGMLTTIQDLGRHGSRHLGVGNAGALDAYSHSVANLLAGNPVGTATLEITLAGPRLAFDEDTVIALCGAQCEAAIDGIPLPGWRRAWVPAGAMLELHACRHGSRAYLAVSGGFAVDKVLGSASTDLRGGFGGLEGRALVAGDVLVTTRTAIPNVAKAAIARWWIDPSPDLEFGSTTLVRVLPGGDSTTPGDALFSRPWRVSNTSNRQGLRLEGDALDITDVRERVSEPVPPGTLQLPPDGQPIVLLADAQTHGGYPRIGHAIHADWPRLAQLRAGDAVYFVPCTQSAARDAQREQAQRLARIALAIATRRMAS